MRPASAWLGAVMLVSLAAGCDESSGAGAQLVELGPLVFEVPLDWQRHDSARPGATTAMWTPQTNDRKESVTVIRTDRPDSAVGKPSVTTVQQQLVTAQQALRNARIARVQPVTTAHGLAGAQVELAYRPSGVERDYRRVHVVLVEDDATLIHVLYTAADPGEQRGGLQHVLDTLRTRGGQS